MPKYKNISDQTLWVPNVGEAAPGEILESKDELNNPNLEPVTKTKKSKEK